jgi:hypothetical protein
MKAGVISSHARWLTLATSLLCAGALADDLGSPKAYPRALAAADSQRLAAAIQRNVSPLTPAVPALLGAHGAIKFQRLLGEIFLAMDAYAHAEDHLRRAHAIAIAVGNAEDAAAAAVDLGEIALLTGRYDRAEQLSNDLAQLAARADLPWAQAKAEEYLGVVAGPPGPNGG